MLRTARGFLRGDSNLSFDAVFLPKGTDISGNGLHASDTGTLGVPVRVGQNKTSRRVWAKGTGEYFSYGGGSSLDPGTPFTIGCIVKTHDVQSDQNVLNNQNDSTHGFFISGGRGSPVMYPNFQANTAAASWSGGVTATDPAYPNKEVFVVGVCVGTERRIYVNGRYSAFATAAGTYQAGSLSALTSAYANNTGAESGRSDYEISEIFIIKRALSPVEVFSMNRYLQNKNPLNKLFADAIQLVGLTDSGAGSDSLSALLARLTASETGSGSDAFGGLLARLTQSEVATGSDALAILAQLAVSDTGIATEAIAILVSLALSDSGSAADAQSILAQISAQDSGTATDVLSILAQIIASDTGNAAEALAIAAALSVSDAGSGVDLESVFQAIAVSDTGAGADVINTLIRVIQSDSGIASDALSVLAQIVIADAAHGSENPLINAILSLSDTGAAVDAANSLVKVAQSDSGSATEAINWIGKVLAQDFGSSTEALTILGKVYPYLKKATPYKKLK